jgi:hypothetical protein
VGGGNLYDDCVGLAPQSASCDLASSPHVPFHDPRRGGYRPKRHGR